MKEKVEQLFEQYRLQQKSLSQVKAEILLLFDVVGRSEQLSCPRCRHTGIDTGKDGINYCRSCSHYWRAT